MTLLEPMCLLGFAMEYAMMVYGSRVASTGVQAYAQGKCTGPALQAQMALR